MTIDRNYDEGGLPVRGESTEPSGGIYSLPAIGNAFWAARRFYDEMAPQDADSTGVRVGKEVFRWVPVVGGAAVGAAVGAVVAL
jgi:hypothetical protein